MTYQIVFVEKPNQGRGPDRAVGDSVFLSNLPTNPKVFTFFYQGSTGAKEVEEGLRALGRKTGDNLFVNIASQADPDYDKAEKRFGLRRWPVVVVTAISPLAATPEGDNAFVRLDSKALFAKPEELVRTVEQLFNLFLGGEIGRAVTTGWTQQGKAGLLAAADRIWSVVQPVIDWISKRDLAFEFAGAKIEVKEGGRH
jgi:hypothetical protein